MCRAQYLRAWYLHTVSQKVIAVALPCCMKIIMMATFALCNCTHVTAQAQLELRENHLFSQTDGYQARAVICLQQQPGIVHVSQPE